MITIERDVVIVGAGPAGAICAAYLAKAGADVLLLDKELFPRDKACGDIQGEEIVTHIHQLGAFDQLDAIGACIRRLQLLAGDRQAVVPFECYCTPRWLLDELLTRTACKWGAQFRQGCRFLDVIQERGFVKGVRVRYQGEETEIRCKLVIGADGAASSVAKALGIMKEKGPGIGLGQRAYFKGIGLDRHLSKDQYDACGLISFDRRIRPGYFWIMPSGSRGVSQGICNVGGILWDRDNCKGSGIQERFYSWVSQDPQIKRLFADAVQISPWETGKLTDITQNMKTCGDGFLLIGDAASRMLPLKNDGLSAAADSGFKAAAAALEALRREDYSAEYLNSKYDPTPDGPWEEAGTLQDELKLRKLTMESMYDPQVMEQTVQRLAQRPTQGKA